MFTQAKVFNMRITWTICFYNIGKLTSIYNEILWNFKVVKWQMFRSSHQRCSMKKVFLEISQNSQKNTCARASFLIKLQACNFI